MIPQLLFLVINILMYLSAPNDMDHFYMWSCMMVAFFSLLVFLKACGKDPMGINRIHLRHSVYFMICYIIVFYQCCLDYLLGLADLSNTYLWYDTTVVAKSLALSNIGLTSIFLGYIINMNINIVDATPKKDSSASYCYPQKNLLLFVAILLILLYIIFVPKDYLNNGYARGLRLESGLISMIMGYLVSVFVAILVLYSAEYRLDKRQSWLKVMRWPIVVISVYILIIVITGRRTEALRMFIMLLISFLYCRGGKVHYMRLGAIALAGAISFAIIGIFRDLEAGSVQKSVQILSKYDSVLPFTKEIAGSVNTLFIAMSYFPEKIDYTYGATFFPGFLKLVPGLSSLYINYFLPEGANYSSDIIISSLYFDSEIIWGLGSSINADIYISFGPIGVIVVMMLFGYFLRFLEVGTFRFDKSIYFLALSFGCYSQFIYVCRQSIPVMFLCWAYASLLLYLVTRKKVIIK